MRFLKILYCWIYACKARMYGWYILDLPVIPECVWEKFEHTFQIFSLENFITQTFVSIRRELKGLALPSSRQSTMDILWKEKMMDFQEPYLPSHWKSSYWSFSQHADIFHRVKTSSVWCSTSSECPPSRFITLNDRKITWKYSQNLDNAGILYPGWNIETYTTKVVTACGCILFNPHV